MNSVTLTGSLAGDSELRTLESSGRELLNFDVCVDGKKKGESPIVRCAYFPANGGVRELKAGERVLVTGSLRHRRDYTVLFVAVGELAVIT